MYELKLFNYLEEQYNTLIREGVLQLDVNWELHKPFFMRRKDKKYYEILLKEFIDSDMSTVNFEDLPAEVSDSRTMIKKFFLEFLNYTRRVAEFYKDHWFKDHPNADPLSVPSEILNEAAMVCRLVGLPYEMSRHFNYLKRYKFLKLKGKFEKVGYDKREKDANRI